MGKIGIRGTRSGIDGSRGFSLVEMMVIVAIVGILSSIAIPSYNAYTAKARQSEAKTNLAAIYSAEAGFYAEYGFYTTCLTQIGFQPTGAVRFYTIGFDQNTASYSFCGTDGSSPCYWYDTTGADKCNYSGDTAPSASLSDTDIAFTANVFADNSGSMLGKLSTIYMQGNWPKTGMNGTGYGAGANGSILKGAPYDSWRMQSDKTLINIQSGL